MSTPIRPISFVQHVASIGPHAPEASHQDPHHPRLEHHCHRPLEACSNGPARYAEYLEAQNKTAPAMAATAHRAPDRVELTGDTHQPLPERSLHLTDAPDPATPPAIERVQRYLVPVPAGVTIDLFA